MKSLIAIVVLSFVLFQPAHADLSKPIVSQETTNCLPSEKEPAGQYKGLCMDLDEDRPTPRAKPQIVEHLAQEFGDKSLLPADGSGDKMVLENFLYHEKFYRAVIPVNKIHQVIYQMIDIAPTQFQIPKVGLKIPNPGITAYHTQLRFQLDRKSNEPLELIGYDGSFLTISSQSVESDFVYALWALRAKGHEEIFSPKDGAEDNYGVAYSVQSLHDATDWVISSGLSSHQYLINLDPQKTQELFRSAVFNSEKKGTQTVYNTLDNDCVNASFDILIPIFHELDPILVPSDNSNDLIRRGEVLTPYEHAEFWHMLNNQVKLPSVTEELSRNLD